LNPADSGREICKETIFLLENGIFRQKNRCGCAVHAAASDFIFRSIAVFDKQSSAPLQKGRAV